MSAMVYLPRDRYTTKVRLAMEAILLEAFDGDSADYTARVSESVLARLHYVVRGRAGEPLADVDSCCWSSGSPRRPAPGTTTSPRRCSTSWARSEPSS